MHTKVLFRSIVVFLLAVLLLAACGGPGGNTEPTPIPTADTSTPNTAPSPSIQPGDTIDGISCDSGGHDNQYHVHDAIFVYFNGIRISLPGALGQVPQIPCLYWLHTHSDSAPWGILHMEAPRQANSLPPFFTLQQFWDIWELTSPNDFPSYVKGSWIVYVDGKQVPGGSFFSTISLNPDLLGHHIIVMANNTDPSTLQLPNASTFDWHGFGF